LTDQTPRTIEFADNRVVAEIIGPHSRNLANIERAFEIEVAHRGNILTLHGDDDAVVKAVATIRALETRFGKGRPIEPGDVAGAIRFATEGKPKAVSKSIRANASSSHARPARPNTSRRCRVRP
jgi:phosphate starvation-inducible PhoH-like protein